jgi:quinohemoprotein ethanol dehydrogenase
MAYDVELDLLYIGTGNGSPWNQSLRSPGGGDNLFLSSIVALDPDDGRTSGTTRRRPARRWDYTATQPMSRRSIRSTALMRRVLMQAPKNGFFYVLDAATGELISADKFAAVNWATGIDSETGRPIENPAARYDRTGRAGRRAAELGRRAQLAPDGVQPADRARVSVRGDNALVYAPDRNFDPSPLTSNLGIDLGAGMAELGPNPFAGLPMGSYALGWDPVAQREGWRAEGAVRRHARDRRAGSCSTATPSRLVARSPRMAAAVGVAGSADRRGRGADQFRARRRAAHRGRRRALDGELLRAELRAPAGVQASARSETLPPPSNSRRRSSIRRRRPRRRGGSRAVSAYQANCMICHEDPGNAGGMFRRGLFPDLAYSRRSHSRELFNAIVLDGVRAQNGMASFADALGAEDADAIRAYLIDRANAALPAGAARSP